MLMVMALRTTSRKHKKSLICSESQCSENPAISTTLRMESSLDMLDMEKIQYLIKLTQLVIPNWPPTRTTRRPLKT